MSDWLRLGGKDDRKYARGLVMMVFRAFKSVHPFSSNLSNDLLK